MPCSAWRKAVDETKVQTSSPPIAVDDADWQQVLSILEARVPERDVWAFGSRATGEAKRFSDLDLALAGAEPLSLTARAQLAEDFEVSDLPFRVDLIDLAVVEPSFSARVLGTGVLIQKGRKDQDR